MNLEEFMKLLSKAKRDRYGNLYVEEKELNFGIKDKEFEKHRWYFSLTNTVCDDLIKEYASRDNDGYEIYDRHFWNDDTLQIKIIREKNKNND